MHGTWPTIELIYSSDKIRYTHLLTGRENKFSKINFRNSIFTLISENYSFRKFPAIRYKVMFDEFPKHFVTLLPLLCVIGELSMSNFHRLKEVLVEIKRIDLKNRVEEFEKKLAATRRIPLNATVKQSM